MRQENHAQKDKMIELTVIVKDDEKTLKTKTLVYEPFILVPSDPTLKEAIDRTIAEFKGDATDVQVKVSMTL